MIAISTFMMYDLTFATHFFNFQFFQTLSTFRRNFSSDLYLDSGTDIDNRCTFVSLLIISKPAYNVLVVLVSA